MEPVPAHYDVVRHVVVRHVVENGVIGEVVTVVADHGQRLYRTARPGSRSTEFAGGALLDLGVYLVSFADWVLGAPTSVSAAGTLTDLDLDPTTTITVTGAG